MYSVTADRLSCLCVMLPSIEDSVANQRRVGGIETDARDLYLGGFARGSHPRRTFPSHSWTMVHSLRCVATSCTLAVLRISTRDNHTLQEWKLIRPCNVFVKVLGVLWSPNAKVRPSRPLAGGLQCVWHARCFAQLVHARITSCEKMSLWGYATFFHYHCGIMTTDLENAAHFDWQMKASIAHEAMSKSFSVYFVVCFFPLLFNFKIVWDHTCGCTTNNTNKTAELWVNWNIHVHGQRPQKGCECGLYLRTVSPNFTSFLIHARQQQIDSFKPAFYVLITASGSNCFASHANGKLVSYSIRVVIRGVFPYAFSLFWPLPRNIPSILINV